MRDDTPEGAETRANLVRVAEVEQRKSNEMIGAELGYRYVGSPLIWPEPGEGPERRLHPLRADHLARARGCRTSGSTTAAPCRTGSATATRCSASAAAPPMSSALGRAFRAIGAPFTVLDVPDAPARDVYGYDLLLLRPDLHVAWRGNAAARGAGAARRNRDRALGGRTTWG